MIQWSRILLFTSIRKKIAQNTNVKIYWKIVRRCVTFCFIFFCHPYNFVPSFRTEFDVKLYADFVRFSISRLLYSMNHETRKTIDSWTMDHETKPTIEKILRSFLRPKADDKSMFFFLIRFICLISIYLHTVTQYVSSQDARANEIRNIVKREAEVDQASPSVQDWVASQVCFSTDRDFLIRLTSGTNCIDLAPIRNAATRLLSIYLDLFEPLYLYLFSHFASTVKTTVINRAMNL